MSSIKCTDITCKYNKKEKCTKKNINIITNITEVDNKRTIINICNNKEQCNEFKNLVNKVAESILKEI